MNGGAVARAGPLELLGMRADARDEAERLGRGGAHVEPGVTPVAVVHELRRGLEVLPLEPALPEVGRLDGVRVGRDDAVRAGHAEGLAGERARGEADDGEGERAAPTLAVLPAKRGRDASRRAIAGTRRSAIRRRSPGPAGSHEHHAADAPRDQSARTVSSQYCNVCPP